MAFHEVRFPDDISLGSVSGLSFRTLVTVLSSGREQRVGTWSGGRMRFNVAYGIKHPQSLAVVQEFFRARNGALNGFRLKDFLDFHSNPTDPTYRSAKGTRDQVLGAGDGSRTAFQLLKTYVSGAVSVTRNVTKPVSGTVDVWVDGVLKMEGADYTVNTVTGIVTFTAAPAGGLNVEASFEFDVPVRFDDGADAFLAMSADGFDEGSVSDIDLIELLDEAGGYSHEFFYGGTKEMTFGADIEVDPDEAYTWRLSASTTGLNADMKSPTNLPDGRPLLSVINNGANSFDVRDEADVTIVTLAAGQAALMSLIKVNAGGTKEWFAV